MSRGRVVFGLSGGVDSAVSAWLLEQQGFEIVGLLIKRAIVDRSEDRRARFFADKSRFDLSRRSSQHWQTFTRPTLDGNLPTRSRRYP